MQRGLKVVSVAVAVLTASALLYTSLKKKPEAPVVYKGAQTEEASSSHVPSINLFTFSLDNMADSTAFWETWAASVTGTCSGGEEYFPHANGHFVLTYFNSNHGLEYSTNGGFVSEMNAYLDSAGHTEADPGCVHWSTLMFQYLIDTWSMHPGWDPSHDANNDGVRDTISDYDHNRNQTNFTVSRAVIYCIRDAGGGRMVWGTNTWQNGIVLVGSTEADTTRISVTRSTPDSLILAAAPPTGITYYIVDKSRTWNPLRAAYRVEHARVGVYSYCQPGEPSVYDTTWNAVGFNFANVDVRHFLARLCAIILRAFRVLYEFLIGIHKDNVWTDWREDKLGWDNNFGNGMASILETGMNTQDDYCVAESLMCKAIQDSVHNNVTGPVTTEGNVGTYRTAPGSLGERYGNIVAPLDGTMFEGVPDGDINYANSYEVYQSYQTERSRNHKVYELFKNSYYAGSSEAYRDSILQAIYCWYYTAIGNFDKTSDTAGFIFPAAYGYGASTIDTASWLRPWAYANLGSPITACSLISDMVYKRMYSNGDTHWIALFHPSDDFPVTVTLDGGEWHLLQRDGTLEPTVHYSSYTINQTIYPALPEYPGITGRIFGKVISSGEPPDTLRQWNSMIRKDTISFDVRDSVRTTYTLTCDIMRLFVSSDTLFSHATKRDSAQNVNAATLHATGLLVHNPYSYWTIACDSGVCDTTARGSVTTDDRPSMHKKKFIGKKH